MSKKNWNLTPEQRKQKQRLFNNGAAAITTNGRNALGVKIEPRPETLRCCVCGLAVKPTLNEDGCTWTMPWHAHDRMHAR